MVKARMIQCDGKLVSTNQCRAYCMGTWTGCPLFTAAEEAEKEDAVEKDIDLFNEREPE